MGGYFVDGITRYIIYLNSGILSTSSFINIRLDTFFIKKNIISISQLCTSAQKVLRPRFGSQRVRQWALERFNGVLEKLYLVKYSLMQMTKCHKK